MFTKSLLKLLISNFTTVWWESDSNTVTLTSSVLFELPSLSRLEVVLVLNTKKHWVTKNVSKNKNTDSFDLNNFFIHSLLKIRI